MNKWPGAPFFWSLHMAGTQIKTLILKSDLYGFPSINYVCTSGERSVTVCVKSPIYFPFRITCKKGGVGPDSR